MGLIDWANIYRFNQACIKEHGNGDTRSLGWRDNNSQRLRFDALADIGDMTGHSVLDVGCGYGDLRDYLGARYPDITYTGIDNMQEFLTIAIERYGHLPDTTFLYGDFSNAILPRADYVFASGSLNYFNNEPGFIYRIIDKLFKTCNIAFGFNLLSDIAPMGLLVAYDMNAIVKYCQKLSPNVILNNSYAADDFTIWMYK
ncbi:hypothetical protein BEL04_02240 [Mucilaginibacter sp. PPCGB 2223]|uniref:class I SAM-dependent methyltransferase n=1 Tax=Mucilaginibacter sp. PPCGB 2223 TaxID=1886027 RepID=UPI00082487C7|nr:class I SAM-dependent methyltransferase [Mucilaginibacter sp. PPCGB 2223]OCX53156.1 hypothetical protein BEL04_02240 [Mucilaginibacter sp. PPCGB 2223]